MAKQTATPSREILEAALHGLEAQRQKLEEQINEVRGMMGHRTTTPAKTAAASNHSGANTSTARKKRVLSAEARKRIAAAQKKRWAAFRKGQG